jgi:hypothetical protein
MTFFFTARNSRILKGLGRKVKEDAEWRLQQKADQQVNKTLDRIVSKATSRRKKYRGVAHEPG